MKYKGWIICGGILVLAAIVVGVYLWQGNARPESVAEPSPVTQTPNVNKDPDLYITTTGNVTSIAPKTQFKGRTPFFLE
ncbi:MAG TPA: hypothetical protein VEC37_08035, partial [Bacillota bacterium]|nr:hypothetical protein [Bacillota bacterium]